MNLEEFDPKIGIDGYCKAIHNILHPNSTSSSIDAAALHMEYRIYPKHSVFSRIRPIQASDAQNFLTQTISRKEFYPPNRSVAKVPMGRFNNQGERKLYLADHPYVALRECGIEPGDYFLLSYFSFNSDTFFIDANPNGSKFYQILNSLFQSKDKRFYEVINRIHEKYLNYKEFQGVAYNSVKAHKGQLDDVWGEIDSITNLAIKEDHMPSADLVGGWLAQCDENYRPIQLRIFKPLNPKKKNKLTALRYSDNRSKFIFENTNTMKEINRLREKSKIRIERKEYSDPQISPIKFLLKD